MSSLTVTLRRPIFQASLVYSEQSPGKGSLCFATGRRDLEYVRGTDVEPQIWA